MKEACALDTAGRGFALMCEMGTGKTLTAIAITGALYQAGKIRRALVISPTSVVSVWISELERHAAFPYRATALLGDRQQRLRALRELDKWPFRGLKVAVINYEATWREGIAEALLAWRPELVIADESQRIKTHNARQSKAVHKLGDQAEYKLILSGTPVQNNAVDLFSQYRFLDPAVFGTNFYAFRNRYCVMGGFNRQQIVGYRNMDELIRKAHRIAYRVTKGDCLDLPEETFENRYVNFRPADRKLYDRLRRTSVAELESGGRITAPTVLTKLLRLQQLTGGFLRPDESARPEHVNSAKLDALMDIVDDYVICEGRKLVVFARFTAEIDLISKALKERGIRFGCLDGRTPVSERDRLVAEFQNDPGMKVFVAQIQTAGLGITLHAASTEVFYSLDFNYASYTQALARIHRVGQHHPCTYIHLLVENTVDEKVLASLRKKDDIARALVDDWRSYFE